MYNREGFNFYQISELEKGIEDNLDCSKFWKKHFDNFQMYQIRVGMKQGLCVDTYAKKYYDSGQMREIRLGMISGVDFRAYAKPELNEYEMFSKRDELEMEMSKVRYLGKMNMFDLSDNNKAEKYKELVTLANLDVSNYSKYDKSRVRAVLPLLAGGMVKRAEEFLSSDKSAFQLEYEVSKIPTFIKKVEYNAIDSEALRKNYPNGYEFIKEYKSEPLNKGDIKVAYIVETFGKISKDILFLKSLICAGICDYSLSFVSKDGFDPKLFTVVIDLIDSGKEYDFVYDNSYTYNQKLELYKATLRGIDLSLFSPEMSLSEMMNLRMDFK